MIAFYLYLIKERWFTQWVPVFLVEEDFNPKLWDEEDNG